MRGCGSFAAKKNRFQRNETPHRMQRKASKRDIGWSRADLLSSAQRHKLNTDRDEFWFNNYMKIDNSDLEPDAVADMVIREFNLVAKEKEEKEYRFGV